MSCHAINRTDIGPESEYIWCAGLSELNEVVLIALVLVVGVKTSR